MIKLVIAAALLGGSAYMAWRMYAFYMTTTGTTMQRLAASFRNSATLFVQAVGAVVLFVGNGVLQLGDFFNAPEIREFVQTHFTPEFATGAFAVLLTLTTMARLRNMGSGGGQASTGSDGFD